MSMYILPNMCYREVLYVQYVERYKFRFTQFVQAVFNTFRAIVILEQERYWRSYSSIYSFFFHLLCYVQLATTPINLFVFPSHTFKRSHYISLGFFGFAFSSHIKWTADFYQVTNILFHLFRRTISNRLRSELIPVCIGMANRNFILLFFG